VQVSHVEHRDVTLVAVEAVEPVKSLSSKSSRALRAASTGLEELVGVVEEVRGGDTVDEPLEHERGHRASHGVLTSAVHGPAVEDEDNDRNPEHGDEGGTHLDAIHVRVLRAERNKGINNSVTRVRGDTIPGPAKEEEVRPAHGVGLEEEGREEDPADKGGGLNVLVLESKVEHHDESKDDNGKVQNSLTVLEVGHHAANPVLLLRGRLIGVEPDSGEQGHSGISTEAGIATLFVEIPLNISRAVLGDIMHTRNEGECVSLVFQFWFD